MTKSMTAATLAALLLAGCTGGQGSSSADQTTLQTAVEGCGLTSKVTAGDNGKTVVLNGAGEDDAGSDTVKTEEIACILATTSVPQYVTSQIDSTRALDGMQHAEWDNYEAQWTYHPDSGLDLTLHQK